MIHLTSGIITAVKILMVAFRVLMQCGSYLLTTDKQATGAAVCLCPLVQSAGEKQCRMKLTHEPLSFSL
jgi:hypothetical protein